MSTSTSLDNSTPHASSHAEVLAYNLYAVRAAVAAEMANTWVDGGADYLYAILESEPPLHCIEEFIIKSPLYEKKRWTHIPTTAKLKNEVREPATAIVNAVLDHFDRSPARRAVDSHSADIAHGYLDERLHWPNIILLMDGKMVDPDIPVDASSKEAVSGLPLEHAVSDSREAESETEEGSNDAYLPTGQQHSPFAKPSYKNMASFVEIELDSVRFTDEFRPQIATYAREVFIQQHNRQHVFGMLLNEQTAEVYQFDRAGAIYTSRVDIHEDPCTFVRMILCITSMDHQALGFDDSIYWSSGKRYLKVGDTNYIIVGGRPVFLSRSIRGRCTTCWDVKVPGSGKHISIKDYWKAEKHSYESDYLLDAKGILGVVQMIDYVNKKSSIIAQRKVVLDAFVSDGSSAVIGDRELCRVVMENCGRPIDQFPDPKQLLRAMHDAINGHRGLFQKYILHRDVSMMNVLVCPTGSPGQFRGVLIDLDLAIRLNRDEGLPKCDYTTGTRFYQSINVLLAEGHHDHLDDLESFFYLLCMLCLGYTGPGQPIVPTPLLFVGWELDLPSVAAAVKLRFVTSARKRLVEVSLVVSPSVKEVFVVVITSLRAFILKKHLAKGERADAQQDDARAGQKERVSVAIDTHFMAVANEEYSEFLGIIGDAIGKLDELAEPESSGAPEHLGVDLCDNVGFGPRSFVPIPEKLTASGGGSKRVFESEQSYEPSNKRTRLQSRTVPESSHTDD